jgi:CRP/FNR family cyclic AMP-dependent transcriptional regulator
MTRQHARTNARQGRTLLESLNVATTTATYEPSTTIFAQGDRCAGVMYIEKGGVRLSVISPHGSRAAVLSVLHAGALFGEGALAGQRHRKSTADAVTACTIISIKTAEMRRRLHDVALGDWFRSQMLARNARIEQDIVHEVFNGSEKRLARALLLLAGFDEHQLPRHALPIISRSVLAEMSGTTQATVGRLMNSFRKRGFVERQTVQNGGVQIHRSMMNVLLLG